MTKRLLSGMLAGMMLFALVGCAGTNASDSSDLSSRNAGTSTQKPASSTSAENSTAPSKTSATPTTKKTTTASTTKATTTTKAPTTSTTKAPTTTTLAPTKLSGKLVALTFDDGPGPHTARLLDALKQRNAHATFFIWGNCIKNSLSYPDLIRRMEAEGHAVGNHSQNHKVLTDMDAAGIAAEMDPCSDAIEAILGHRPVVMRPPGGLTNAAVQEYARSAGMAVINWSVIEPSNENATKLTDIINHFFYGNTDIRDGSIILMHETRSEIVDAIPMIVNLLRSQGFTLVTVPELLEARKGGVIPGEVYTSVYPE